LKLLCVGVILSGLGLYFLIRPKTVIYCTELGQLLIALLAILITLSLVNFYLNIKILKKRKQPCHARNE